MPLLFDQPEGVQRIVAWCMAGCELVNERGTWHLRRPAHMTGHRGPAPKVIRDATARAAIAAGARVGTAPDLFREAA